MRIAHVIAGLGVGGAETTLAKLAMGLQNRGYDQVVLSLSGSGPIQRILDGASIKTVIAPSPNPVRAVRAAAHALRLFKADVVQTWMYRSDFLGSIAAKLAGDPPVIWNIRKSSPTHAQTKLGTRIITRINARTSRHWPCRIVCCAYSACARHVEIGFAEEKIQVIHNGFDTSVFRPDEKARSTLRSNLGVGANTKLIGVVARFHPQKGHAVLFAALGKLSNKSPDAHFVLCGTGVDSSNEELTSLIRASGLRANVHLLGERNDMARVLAGLDILCSPSLEEGLPNSVGEAMSCGVPCVATVVGDTATLVGDTGWLVPIEDASALAGTLEQALDSGEDVLRRRGALARHRILENFGIERMIDEYAALYERCLRGG